MLCIKTAKYLIQILLPRDSPIILVFHHRGSLFNSDDFIHNGAPNTRGEKIGRFLTIEETVRDMAIVALEVEQETIPKLSNGGTFDDLE